jgi:hypothetical protein
MLSVRYSAYHEFHLTSGKQAKYAYRSIAQFIMHITSHSEEHLAQNPFPELHFPRAPIASEAGTGSDSPGDKVEEPERHLRPHLQETSADRASDVMRYRSNEDLTAEEVRKNTSAAVTMPEEAAVDENLTDSQVGYLAVLVLTMRCLQ